MTETPHDPLVKMSIADVEIVKAGTWKGVNGEATVTPAMLSAIVEAAKDPKVPAAPLKLGHSDPRFDGNPAFGWVKNLRLGKGGTSIYGDLVDIPYKLARMIPDYYQRRSAEILPSYVTSDGTTHPLRLSALALLGATEPAVGDLEEIGRLAFSASTPEPVYRAVLSEDDVHQSGGDPRQTGSTSAGPTGSGTGKEDPMTDLSQFRALFGFGDEVTDEQLSARLQASGVLPAEPGETDAQTPPQDATGGTAAGADGAQATGNPPAAPEAPQAPATAAHADTPAEGTQPGAAAFSAGLPEGLTAIRTEDLQALQLSAQRADALFQDATKQRHEQIVAAAFNAGRITNPEREVFLSALSENERLATQILDARPRMFSTSESGSPFAPSVDTDTDDDDELEKLAAENGI